MLPVITKDASRLRTSFYCIGRAGLLHIIEKPEQWKLLEKDVRRCLTRVFPYAVLYTIEPDYILIVAVMHCHREPGYWKKRIP
jgi:hypothetical protein